MKYNKVMLLSFREINVTVGYYIKEIESFVIVRLHADIYKT